MTYILTIVLLFATHTSQSCVLWQAAVTIQAQHQLHHTSELPQVLLSML